MVGDHLRGTSFPLGGGKPLELDSHRDCTASSMCVMLPNCTFSNSLKVCYIYFATINTF